jgi:hypothetical protein
MRKILVIAAAGAALAVGGTTVALAQSGADDGTPAPTSVEPTSTSGSSATRLTETSAATSASPETTRPTGTSSLPAPSTYPTRGGYDDGPTHDLGDDHGGRDDDQCRSAKTRS